MITKIPSKYYPITGGQFHPVSTCQFHPVMGGQLKPARGGQLQPDFATKNGGFSFSGKFWKYFKNRF
ncbi:MAG: hypothetical protein ACKOAD_01675 [Gammaproteobacteria bacterium]